MLSTAGDAELDNALTDSIQMIAAATRVDGAVVLTDRLRLVGFGGEIVVPESSLSTLYFARPGDDDTVDQQSLDTVGTRHRSAARFVQALPEAIAVVVSQDGAVRSFEYSAGRVIGYSHTASRGYAL
jgi:DNA integrity scanning protein DisA with diadenylate cyclase activity